MLILVPLHDSQDAYSLEIGTPLEPDLPLRERIQSILADYGLRRAELYELPTARTIDTLAALLQSAGSDTAELLPLLNATGFLGGADSVPDVEARLEHSNPQVVCAAIRCLGQIGLWTCLDKVKPYLSNADPLIRAEAITAAGKLSAEPLPELAHAGGSDAVLSGRAREAEARIALLAADRLEECVQFILASDENEDLLPMLPYAWKWLADRLIDGRTPEPRRLRIVSLLGLGCAARAFPYLMWIVARPEESREIRLAAISALGRCRARKAVRLLQNELQSQDMEIVRASVVALGKIGYFSSFPPLLDLWKSADPSLRADIRLALRRVARLSAADPLEDFLLRPDESESARGREIAGAREWWTIDDEGELRSGIPRENLLKNLAAGGSSRDERAAALLLAISEEPGTARDLERIFHAAANPHVREILSRGHLRLTGSPLESATSLPSE